MDEAERARTRDEILSDVSAILREQLAGDEWGRVLVEVVRQGEDVVVAGIDVEEIVGDEAKVDAAFADEAAKPLLPVLAKATEALCALDDLELDAVGGGTFLRQRAGGFAWLPGLVHVPSAPLEDEWDDLTAELDARNADLEEQFALRSYDRYDVDLEEESIVFSAAGSPRIVARANLIATLSDASRAWAWGGYNKHLSERVRAASAALVDSILERDMWEISTPVLPADAGTAWVLAALVCDRAGGQGVFRTPAENGVAFLLLRDVRGA
ncbi:MAG TPA: hypothetical protein VIY73_25245 [Polyangiaceae bacterium]